MLYESLFWHELTLNHALRVTGYGEGLFEPEALSSQFSKTKEKNLSFLLVRRNNEIFELF